MKKNHFIMVLFLAFLCFGVSGAFAYDLKPGDLVKYQDGVGSTNGGEFKVDVNPGATFATDFITFCVQTSEYLDFTSTFQVQSINTYSLTDGKPLASQTAWLYHKYRAGTLDDISAYSYNDVNSANALQQAIWNFQGYGSYTNYLTVLANANAQSGNYYGVRIANMVYYTTTLRSVAAPAQDILITPEPTMAIMLGGLLLGIGVLGRRQFLKR